MRPALVLLHGFPFDHRMWADVVALLETRFTVHALDLPGFGGTPLLAADDSFAMTNIAKWVLATIPPEPFIACGLSMGGYIAIELAAFAPPHLRGLVLAATKDQADSPPAREHRLQVAEKVMKAGVPAVVDGMIERLFAPQTIRDRTPLIERARQEMHDAPPQSVAAAQRGMAMRRDTRSVIASLPVPLLCLAGEQDIITPPELLAEMQRAAPNGQLIQFPACGHMIPMERPQEFAAAICEWWQRVTESQD